MGASDNKPRGQIIEADRGSTIQNVIQAVIHLPAWAWIIGAFILSVGLCTACLIAATVFNIGPLQKLLPTPIAFTPATASQSLIIVADFDDRSGGRYEGIDPAQYVYEQLKDQIQKDNLNIRVERLPQVVDDNTAKSTGATYNATLVLWGWYDALTITPRLTRIKTLKGDISNQEGLRLTLANPDKVIFSIVSDLPSQASYLILFSLAIDNFSNERYGEAFVYFDNAIQAVDTNSNSSTNASESYFYRAYIYGNQNDLDHALTDYNKAIELDPDSIVAYNNRGIIYFDQGDFDRAIADYNKAIELDPQVSDPYNNRGLIYYKQGDFDRAIADYNKAIQLDSQYYDSYTNRGDAFDKKSEHDLALADFNKAIQLNPDNPLVYRKRAFSYYSNGEFELALADYNKAIQLDPNDALAYNGRCWINYEIGKYDEALPDCEKAISLDPDNDYIDYMLDSRASVYAALGRTNEAIIDFERILEISTDPELRIRAEEELKKLKGQ